MSHPNPPGLIYRYQGVDNPKYKEFLRSTIVDNKLFFANTKLFNDPFDSRVEFDFSTDKETKSKWVRRFRKRHKLSHRDDRDFRLGVRQVNFEQMIQTATGEIKDKYGACCLTENKDHILMWSHYASQHRGVCFEYKTETALKLLPVLKINYSNEYPLYNYYNVNIDEVIIELLLLKSIEWEYEQEWRLFSFDVKRKDHLPPGLHPLPADFLNGVILGCRADDDLKELVQDLNQQRPNPVQLYEARMKPRAFGLDIVPI